MEELIEKALLDAKSIVSTFEIAIATGEASEHAEDARFWIEATGKALSAIADGMEVDDETL